MDKNAHIDQTGKMDKKMWKSQGRDAGSGGTMENSEHHSSQRAHFEHYLFM